jgi:leader peptidase (prepilin peptidase)/N-methyltransferase
MTGEMAPALAPAAVFGLIIGSFLNVVAWRLPRRLSLVKPRSKCPGCDKPIAPYDNIPLISWMVLRGRCRGCGERISARYPLIEAITAALYAGVVAAELHHPARLAIGLVLVTFLVPITVIDFDVKRIPNVLVWPPAILVLALGASLDPGRLPEQLIAGAAAFLFFFIPTVIYAKGMGMGDVKLAAMLGLALGRAVAPTLLIAMVLGTVVGVGIIAIKGISEGRRTKVPFGPFLAIGAVIAIFLGDAIVDGYTDRF